MTNWKRKIGATILVAEGSTYKEVGEKMGVTKSRVHQYVYSSIRMSNHPKFGLNEKYGGLDYSAKWIRENNNTVFNKMVDLLEKLKEDSEK